MVSTRESERHISEHEVLCGCANLTYAAYRTLLHDKPGISFEEILRRTESGDTCTACLLDLEYHFADIQGRAAKREWSGPKGANKAVKEGVKRRLYAMIDALTPLVPVRKRSWSPILYGPDVDQWLWVANQALLYGADSGDGANRLAPIRLRVRIFDGGGVLRHSQESEIGMGEHTRLNLSAPLKESENPPVGDDLALGTAEVTIWATRPGMWGTTRPQFEIVTPTSTCAVHVSGPGATYSHGFTCAYRPDEDRLFSVVNNPTSKPLRMQLSYRAKVRGRIVADAINSDIVIPPRGAYLGKIQLPEGSGRPAVGDALDLAWRFSDRNKLHIICASPDLDRFSIDHL